MTNMYNMPFAPFIGINRHGQSFMLGCAFVRQELASSFDWVFQTFLEAMGGKPPDNFITDQDGAMRQSIQSIFPTTVHRCCRCHIMKKAQEKVGWLLCRNPGLSDDFNYCVDFSFTPDEFEQNWAGLMVKYEAMRHTHFEKLYEYRSTWVPCYFEQRFFPFLQSTQRSEGFNDVLKRHVNPHNSMLNFVKQYEKIQNHILAKEGCNDYRTEHLEIGLWSNFPIEKQAYKTYTRDLYRKFREEFQLIGRYNAFQVGDDIFELKPNQEFVAKYGSRNYLVQARVEEGSYLCESCKMDKDGILCCHILKVFTHIGVDVIPERYLLRRWTPTTVPSAPGTGYEQPDEMPPQSKKQIRERNMIYDFPKLAKFASGSDPAQAIMMATLEDLLHLQALHGMVLHLLPCLAQQAVPRVLLPMALQRVLTGLIIQLMATLEDLLHLQALHSMLMATLEDLLHLQALHSMVLHLLPCLAQQEVPRVLLPIALQGVLRGLVVQVITNQVA
nr:protein FAR1-RELATED SEQUENCE 5-like [Aegilops tauschii subsp. strangulata]